MKIHEKTFSEENESRYVNSKLLYQINQKKNRILQIIHTVCNNFLMCLLSRLHRYFILILLSFDLENNVPQGLKSILYSDFALMCTIWSGGKENIKSILTDILPTYSMITLCSHNNFMRIFGFCMIYYLPRQIVVNYYFNDNDDWFAIKTNKGPFKNYVCKEGSCEMWIVNFTLQVLWRQSANKGGSKNLKKCKRNLWKPPK